MSSLLPVLSYADDSSDEDSIELDGEMGEMNPEATMLATASMSLPTGDTVVPGSCCIRCQAKRHRAWWWIVPSVFMEVFAAGLVRAIIPVVIVAFFKSTSLGYFNGDGGDSIGGGGAGSFYPTSDSGATTSAQATDHRDASFFFMSSSESLRVIISMAMAPMLAWPPDAPCMMRHLSSSCAYAAQQLWWSGVKRGGCVCTVKRSSLMRIGQSGHQPAAPAPLPSLCPS